METKKSTRVVQAAVSAFFAFCLLASPSYAQDARDFRKNVTDRYEGDDSTSMTVMKLQKIMARFGECEAVDNGEDALNVAVSENPPAIVRTTLIVSVSPLAASVGI